MTEPEKAQPVQGASRLDGMELMTLKILLPYQVYAEKSGISRIVAETSAGSFGLLPHRLDCVAPLSRGILIYECAADGEILVAVDEGVLVKSGTSVLVSVRRAVGGTDLAGLRAMIAREFRAQDDSEYSLRTAMAKMEMGFLRRFSSLRHG
jgi:F-type H+-transporting ATPase subunit epsilon